MTDKDVKFSQKKVDESWKEQVDKEKRDKQDKSSSADRAGAKEAPAVSSARTA